MGFITNYAKEIALKSVLGIPPQYVSSVYLTYSSTEPNIEGTNVTENPNMVRKIIASRSQPVLTLITYDTENEKITNNEEIVIVAKEDFNSENNPTLNYVCLFDDQTGGHLLFFQRLTSPVTLAAGTGVVTRAGQLQIDIVNA